MKLKAGKSYKIKIPNFGHELRKVHIDHVLDNPTILTNSEKLNDDFKLIVYRVWIKHKKYWKWYIDPYYVFCIWNDWEYNKEAFL